MSVLFVVVPLALLVVGAALAAYVWAARTGQFDDTVTPAVRALEDDEPARPEPAEPSRTPDACARPEVGASRASSRLRARQ